MNEFLHLQFIFLLCAAAGCFTYKSAFTLLPRKDSDLLLWILGYLANLSFAVRRVHNLQRALPLCQIALKSIHLVIYNSAGCLKLSINLLATIHILIRLLNASLFDKAL